MSSSLVDDYNSSSDESDIEHEHFPPDDDLNSPSFQSLDLVSLAHPTSMLHPVHPIATNDNSVHIESSTSNDPGTSKLNTTNTDSSSNIAAQSSESDQAVLKRKFQLDIAAKTFLSTSLADSLVGLQDDDQVNAENNTNDHEHTEINSQNKDNYTDINSLSKSKRRKLGLAQPQVTVTATIRTENLTQRSEMEQLQADMLASYNTGRKSAQTLHVGMWDAHLGQEVARDQIDADRLRRLKSKNQVTVVAAQAEQQLEQRLIEKAMRKMAKKKDTH